MEHRARSNEPHRILIVDDEAAQMRALCATLGECGYETTGVATGAAALEVLKTARFDVLLADLTMPGMDGIELLGEARKADPDIAGVIMTGKGTIGTAVEAMKSGALDYILKPFKLSLILPVLERAIAVRHLRIVNAELEASVRQRTAELEAANRELEAFSRSVSHDLRSPLMVIMACTERLIEENGPALPDDAYQSLQRIERSVERMDRLIDDLLRLANVGRQPLERRPIVVRALVDEVVAEVTAVDPQRDVKVRLGDLPDCVGDPGLLRQVFVNLVSNAVKFTRGVPQPVIEVTCERGSGENVYCVRDNGAGFDMRLADKLFGAFQRLHRADQFEGTGVGLSIVHRIVERHGGRIWAESAVGSGATFRFSLPAC
jgi:signal transduction histidine kinase